MHSEEENSVDGKCYEMPTNAAIQAPHVIPRVRRQITKEVATYLVHKLVVRDRQTAVAQTEWREDQEDVLQDFCNVIHALKTR